MGPEDLGVPEVFSGECELGPYVGPWLTPGEYEVLCRYALSREYGMPLHWIKTGHLQGPSRATRHQIDLYWTSHDGVCDFLCIANAKFRKKVVPITDVMTLLGVQQAVLAQKVMLITNTGYSEACGAGAVTRTRSSTIHGHRPRSDISAPRRYRPFGRSFGQNQSRGRSC